MKKKVIITGISSEIMQKIAQQFGQGNYEVIGVSRTLKVLENVTIVNADINNLQSIKDTFSNCQAIIHGAAITHTKREKDYLNINYNATKKLVELAKQNQVEHLIFISSYTASLAGGGYAKSKYLAEEYIKENFRNYTIIRLSEVFGTVKSEGIEKLIQDAFTKKIVLCPTGLTTKLYPIYIEDAVKQTTKLIQQKAQGLYIINGAKGYSYFELLRVTKELTQRNFKVVKISKIAMKMLGILATILPFNIGMVPDQVKRLYVKKEIAKNNTTTTSIEEYVNKLNAYK